MVETLETSVPTLISVREAAEIANVSRVHGRQVMETAGAERDGVTERQAREALADRLSDVRRKGYRSPPR